MGARLGTLEGRSYEHIDISVVGPGSKKTEHLSTYAACQAVNAYYAERRPTTQLPFHLPDSLASLYFNRGKNWERLVVSCGNFSSITVPSGDRGASLHITGELGQLRLYPKDTVGSWVGRLEGPFRVVSVEATPWTWGNKKKRGRYASAVMTLQEKHGSGRVTLEVSAPGGDEEEIGGRFLFVERGGQQAIVADIET
mmetsp:Transcript_18518/g.40213  ORF Transcript_18518/g.40213 Transcript_18518/m.40213 type:complete len:197 (+) Transcript_18518:2-592(+)